MQGGVFEFWNVSYTTASLIAGLTIESFRDKNSAKAH